jgi:DNA-binding transcriptional regulator YiaG
MPTIGALLKQEIVRLSRREARKELRGTKSVSAQHRAYIAALKRRVAVLERQVAVFGRAASARPQEAPEAGAPAKVRFVAKGLRSHRARLGLSAAEYGRLAGVSAQSVYNWELGHATPRPAQTKALAALRVVGKREARRRLEPSRDKRQVRQAAVTR